MKPPLRSDARLLLAATLLSAALALNATAQVVISEIMYNPDGSDTEVGAAKEWVELYNAGRRPVDLSGWTIEDLQDQQASSPLPAGTTLGVGQAMVVTGDSATFDAQWGGVTSSRVQVAGMPSFANSPSATNETVGLRNAAGVVVDSVNYDDEGGWPSDSPDGSSIMLRPESLSTAGNDAGGAWLPSMVGVYGSRFAADPSGAQDRASPGHVDTVPQGAFEPSPDAAWSMVVIPDTQAYVKSAEDVAVFEAMTQWVVDHHEQFGVQFVLHEGDIVNQNSQVTPTSGDQSGDQQWANAKQAMSRLDGVVPYAFSPGNHDYGTTNAQDRSTQFNDYFKQTDNPLVAPAEGGTLAAVMTPGELDNSLHEFTAPDGREMLIVTTEWGPRQEAVDWANRSLRQTKYLDHTAVLLTHAYMYHDETRLDWSRNQDADPDNNQGGNPHSYATSADTHDGEDLWQELVSPNAPFEMVLSGHIGGDGTGYLASEGAHGQTVHQMLLDTQFETNGGNGWIRVLEFLDDGRTVRVRTYSPWHDLSKTDAANAFEFQISPLLAGDFNGDSVVDAADYAVWREALSTGSLAADANGDQTIDRDDYDIWRANFGRRNDAAAAAVPEGASLTLLAVALLATGRTRRRGV